MRGGHTTTGLPNALAGIGFDTWGQFSQDLSNGVGCVAQGGALSPQTVTVRGPGNGTDGYCLVVPGQAVTGIYGATRADATRHVEISIDPRGMVNDYVVVKVDGNEVFDWPLHSFAPSGYTGDTLETVNRYRFGFGSNTGGFGTNVNEVWNIHAVFPVSLRVDTSTTETRFSKLHQVLHYQFRIINIGGDSVRDCAFTTARFGCDNLHCPVTTLVPAQSHDLHRDSSGERRAGVRKLGHRQGVGDRHPRLRTPRRLTALALRARALNNQTLKRWRSWESQS